MWAGLTLFAEQSDSQRVTIQVLQILGIGVGVALVLAVIYGIFCMIRNAIVDEPVASVVGPALGTLVGAVGALVLVPEPVPAVFVGALAGAVTGFLVVVGIVNQP